MLNFPTNLPLTRGWSVSPCKSLFEKDPEKEPQART